MTILIAGHRGFVGQKLTKHISPHSYDLLDRHQLLKNNTPPQKIYWGRPEDINQATYNCTTVINLIARSHKVDDKDLSDSQLKELYNESNTIPALRLAKACIESGVSRYIYLSSIKANGETSPSDSLTVNSACNPEDNYGQSKLHTEQELIKTFKKSNTQLIIIRPPLVYGSQPKGHLAQLQNLLQTRLPLPIEQIQNRRSLIGAHNLCSLIKYCATHEFRESVVSILACDNTLSTPVLTKKLAHLQNNRPRIFSCPPKVFKLGLKLIGKDHWYQKLTADLIVKLDSNDSSFDWTPPYTFEDNFKDFAQL